MGQEIPCRMQHLGRTLAGKAYLESDHILFRGEERVKIALADLRTVAARDGVLHFSSAAGDSSLELGATAGKWAQKILHPPSRADKLGIKPGITIHLAGEFDDSFLAELGDAEIATGKAQADLTFLSAPDSASLQQIPKLANALKPAGALWVVYPKGVRTIREIEVLEAGRAAGLKDTKVASFSATHTALRFVRPLAAR